ncbi:SDR family NAD(P)-dependent oxidoreductase [Prauserella flavalba]|uniref:2-hydroxycyclohexanecarboxyl-CoA dehydrogenase n=1 Tax=Prauserella flavalba TaxID=1477506 RepID=A0A318LAY4_9PSEU|nr:SDR family oxidoreductase [Prauserella flavalba]PXY18420.1 2-hydroxycyclohexanecarboxyl-CoA dehydrogenase [Prauserella flavalba]
MGTDKRVAIVTGGGQGIGRGISEALAEDGFHVAIVDRDEATASEVAKALQDRGLAASPHRVDVTGSARVAAVVDEITTTVGPIHVLVNNAGFDEHLLFVDTEETFWDRIIDVNFKAALRFVRQVLPGMLERKAGRIINIGSDAGRVGSSMEAVYSGAKGGIIAFTKTIARESARAGVTANTVCPGPTRTPAMESVLEKQEKAEATMQAMVRAVPMRRLGEPADIAAAVRFFASDGAGFITGQTLSVSGGLTMA